VVVVVVVVVEIAFQRRGPNMVARAVRLSSVGLYHGKAGLFSKRSLATL